MKLIAVIGVFALLISCSGSQASSVPDDLESSGGSMAADGTEVGGNSRNTGGGIGRSSGGTGGTTTTVGIGGGGTSIKASTGGANATGGRATTGGTRASGGASLSGGSNSLATGGDSASGGNLSSSGGISSGGKLGSGGSISSGGKLGSGGSASSGGKLGSGGSASSGGKLGSGGSTGSGGASGAGGAGGNTGVDLVTVCASRTCYFVDADSGADSNDGRATNRAWKTLAPVNSQTFKGDDWVLFKAGTTYSPPSGSSVALSLHGSGTSDHPIVLDVYGAGSKPLIRAGGILTAMQLENVSFWEVNNLEITNFNASAPTQRQDNRTGIRLKASSGVRSHLYVRNMYVHDVTSNLTKGTEGHGILFESSGTAYFDDVRIENNYLLRTDRNGICQQGTGAKSTNVRIRYNLLEHVGGDGIKLWGSSGGLVEYNVLHGGNERALDASAGMWPFASTNSVFQFNEVSGMKQTVDGFAFDSDYDTDTSLFQYNYSHDNDGGFFLICSPNSSFNKNTTVRYNISVNDGINDKRNNVTPNIGFASGAGFTISGQIYDAKIYNNLVYIDKNAYGALNIPVVRFGTWIDNSDQSNGKDGRPRNTALSNNIFYVATGATGRWEELAQGLQTTFTRNSYFGNLMTGRPVDATAITSNPLLVNPGSAPNGLDQLSGYMLQSGSPLRSAGVLMSANGGRDFWNNPVSATLAPSVGPHEP